MLVMISRLYVNYVIFIYISLLFSANKVSQVPKLSSYLLKVDSLIKLITRFYYLLQFDLCEPADVMHESHWLAPPQERPRSTRSHSLKSMSQLNLPTQRTRRIFSLPSKPVIPPYITIQGCHDNQDSNSEEEEVRCEWNNESMGE